MKNLQTLTLAELVNSDTSAAVFFERYQLDFCCNGKRTLEEACTEKGLNVEQISKELRDQLSTASDRQGQTFDRMSLTELSGHIEDQHHAYVRQMIPVLIGHTKKVADRHGGNNPNLVVIADLWAALAQELTQHMYKEENILFPYVRRLEEADKTRRADLLPQKAFISHPIQVMELEHDKAGEITKKIRELSNQFTPPLMACTTYRLSFRELKEFEADLHQHIHLENNILFPKAIRLEEQLLEQVL